MSNMRDSTGHGSRARYLAELKEFEVSKLDGGDAGAAAVGAGLMVGAARTKPAMVLAQRRAGLKEQKALLKNLRKPGNEGLLAPDVVGKASREPLKTTINDADTKRLVSRHGATGTLPKGLGREERMAAYEARYVHSGGKKGEKWQGRANAGDKTKNVGLGAATAAGAGYLAAKTRPGMAAAKKVKQVVPALRPARMGHLETAGVASATVGGAGELYASHARHKRASYASAPGGVAASALRRMRGYETRSTT